MSQAHEDPEEFFPKGAIAFFGLVIAIIAMVWIAAYVVMIVRHTS